MEGVAGERFCSWGRLLVAVCSCRSSGSTRRPKTTDWARHHTYDSFNPLYVNLANQ